MQRAATYVLAHPELGYRSASDLATDAIRRRLDQLDERYASSFERVPLSEDVRASQDAVARGINETRERGLPGDKKRGR